jgi:lycopene beta-cyclase
MQVPVPRELPKTSSNGPFDVVLVGGGLQNALIALALFDRNPDARVALVERSDRVGGNHTWSFHSGDVPDGARSFTEPLVVHRWSGYDVAFPNLERGIAESYATITSERLRAIVERRFRDAPNAVLLTGADAVRLEPSRVVLDDGRVFYARLVVDARGPGAFPHSRRLAFQKFVGLELELNAPQSRSRPLLMDARVDQDDGFHFFYVLPFSARRVLVENTYFSDTSTLDVRRLHRDVLAYAESVGFDVKGVVREESGVLPLPLAVPGNFSEGSPLVAGYAGGFFHPTTGYSFPVALRLALHIANTSPADRFGARWSRFASAHRRQFRFAAFLNQLLFTAFEPEDRWNVLERFYRMPDDSIRRFYALETTAGDRLRLLCGRPPRGVKVSAALFGGVSA